tara:strand:+ start:245 stop:664 length:420 start_codon:yes stop_codon:yes gene_type:complete
MEINNDYSKNLFDIYSFSHVSHGILFYLFFKYLKVNFLTGLYLTIILEFLWEMFENTEFIICLYRKDYGNYEGDSYLNITGDIIATIIGYLFASKTIYGSILFLIISEILLIPYKANFLQLSVGSLLKKTNLSSCHWSF